MGVNGIYGLSGSGLDIESMVKVGMMSKQNEYDKMAQKYTKNEWTKTAYLDLSSTITTFNLSTLSQYKMSNTMNAKNAESTSSAIKVTANASAGIMNHQVSVTSLSTNAYLVGTHSMTRYNVTSTDAVKNSSVNLADVLFNSVTLDTTDPDNVTIKGTIAKVTAESSASGDGTKPTLTDNLKFGTDGTVKLTDTAFEFTISDGKDSKKVSYTYEDLLGTKDADGNTTKAPVTFNDLVSKINGLGLNVRAAYDSVNDKFSFHNTDGGDDNKISITLGDKANTSTTRPAVAARNFFDNMGLYQSSGGQILDKNGNVDSLTTDADGNIVEDYTRSFLFKLGGETSIAGTSGQIVVDGLKYATEDNKVTVGGITYTALTTTPTDSPALVTVTQDVDAIVDKVKSFVEDYNKLLSSLYEKYDEKPESGYTPLTQTQKDGMKEEQIEKWEEKAKKGLLYHDQTIGKIISAMRDAIASPIESIDSKYNSAYSLGISTTGIKGQLVLDESKLRAAIADDSDAVYRVFATLDESTTDKNGNVINNPDGNGIAQRLGDVFTTATKSIKTRAGSSSDITEDSDLNSLLRQLQTKMSNFKKMMNSFEDALYKKYDKMETTLASLGAQMNFIMGNNA